MKKINFQSQVLPHLVAIVAFLLITVLFYNPIFFENKDLNQHDILQGLGAGQETRDYRAATGEEALWTNSMFGGMPAYLINTQWSGDLLLPLRKAFSLWLPSPASVTFVGMLSFYLALLIFGVRPYLAIAGGLAFALGSFNIISIEAGHMWKVWAIAYMPLVLAGVHLSYKGKWLWGFTLTSLALALEIRSNHLQITYYLLLILLIYGLVSLIYSIREHTFQSFFKATGIVVAAGVLAIACNLGKLWTVYEYGQYSIRGASELTVTEASQPGGVDRDYAFNWSNGIFEPITLLIPEFYGGATTQSIKAISNLGEALKNNGLSTAQIKEQTDQVQTYWGQQPGVAGPIYAGAIVCFLFILGIVFADRKMVYWLVAAAVLSILLSWGKNFESFNYFIFDYLPGYNKFRAASMAITIALVCIPLLGFLGLERLFQEGLTDKAKKKLFIAGLIPVAFTILVLLFAGLGDFQGAIDQRIEQQVPEWYMDALRADRAVLMRSDAIRSMLLLLAAFGIIYFYLQKKMSMYLAVPLLTALILGDLYTVNKRYLTKNDFARNPERDFAQTSEADAFILNDPSPNYRVLTFLRSPWSDANTSYHHKSIGGYHGAKMRRYNDLIERCITSEYSTLLQSLRAGTPNFSGLNTLNMLNTKYIIAGNTPEAVLSNSQALGNAWFVSQVQEVQSPDEEIEALCQTSTASTAIVDVFKFPLPNTPVGAEGNITLQEYQPNYLKYQSKNSEPGFAVFSEIYYPKGWKATIDGQETSIIRANYVLRALSIPAGSHAIEFFFQPASYYTGNKVMMVSSILLLLVFLTSCGYSIKKLFD